MSVRPVSLGLVRQTVSTDSHWNDLLVLGRFRYVFVCRQAIRVRFHAPEVCCGLEEIVQKRFVRRIFLFFLSGGQHEFVLETSSLGGGLYDLDVFCFAGQTVRRRRVTAVDHVFFVCVTARIRTTV